MEWMILPIRRYAQFSGRSRRKEYWMFFLFNILVGLGFLALMLIFGGAALFAAGAGGSGGDPDANPAGLLAAGGAVGIIYIVNLLFSLAMLIPSIAVGVRRLHDTNRTGWWLLAPLAPYVVMLVATFGMVGMAASGAGGDGIGMAAGVLVGLSGLAVLVLAIVVLVFFCSEGTRGPNRFGPDPKDPGADLESVFS